MPERSASDMSDESAPDDSPTQEEEDEEEEEQGSSSNGHHPSGQQLTQRRRQPSDLTPGRQKLWGWLNRSMKVEMTDGRILIGVFLCTDRDANVILGSCNEYLKPDETQEASANNNGKGVEEPRVLGLAMVPGRHIVSICVAES